jgi:3D (Asp-Asp-Asp) domain-containing protein
MSLCLCLSLFVTTASLKLTYISDSDGAERVLLTGTSDPESLMRLSGIEAEEGDEVVYYTAFGGSLANLNIQRAFTVTVEVDGTEVPLRMLGGTVEEALERAGVLLGEDDYTEPALDSTVYMGQTIQVHRVSYEQTVEYETIPSETQYIYTSLYYRNTGKTTTVQQGSDGQRAITTLERWVDGVLESSEVVDTTNTIEATNTVIKTYGAGAPVSSLTGPDGTTNAPTTYKKVLTGRATGYSSSGGRGASGLGLGYGTVAVNPNVIPYGTLLYIASTDGKFVYGYAIATDTGTALMDGRVLVDLYYETRAESILNGVINVNVYVVE